MKVIVSAKYESPAWVSDRASLLEIIGQLEKMGIEPPTLEQFSLSKFRAIIKSIRLPARKREVKKVEDIIKKAKTLPYTELKLKLKITTPEDILLNEKKLVDGRSVYELELRPDQLDRIKKSTKAYFKFK